jgi:Uma2 family endonuclease
MSAVETLPELEYPESDGKPMAETDIHWRRMVLIRTLLEWRYRRQRVYVGSNLLVYYKQGAPRKCFAPDVFVVKDCPPGDRRTFRIWEEGRTPSTIFEVTSLKTRNEDEVIKPRVYSRIGVQELFLFDPTSDYLDPALQGFHFDDGRKLPILPDATGALESRELGLHLRLEDGVLVFYDAKSGERLLTEAEAEHQARVEAEQEVERLRAQLARRRRT